MDQFKQAINLARGAVPLAPDRQPLGDQPHPTEGRGSPQEFKTLPLKAAYLELMRIVSHNKDDCARDRLKCCAPRCCNRWTRMAGSF